MLTANPEGDAAVADLKRAGVEVAGGGRRARSAAASPRPAAASGVRAVELADGPGSSCDLLVTAVGWTAPTSLLNMAGDRPVYDPRGGQVRPGPRGCRTTCWSPGGIAGDGSVEELIAHAGAVGPRRPGARRIVRRAAQAAVPARRRPMGRDRPRRTDSRARPLSRSCRSTPIPELFRGRTHGFVDFCEDVSSKDLVAAVAEGYDSIELAKRFTTATMGPAQGKLETVNTVAVVAEATGATIAETGHDDLAPARMRRSPSARWPGRPSSRCGTRRCSPGTRRTAPPAGRRAPGSGPTTTVTRRPRSRNVREQRRHHRRHPDRQARPARPRRAEAAQPAVRQQVVQARRSAGSGTA